VCNEVTAEHVTGQVVQAPTIGQVTVVAGPNPNADELDAAVRVVVWVTEDHRAGPVASAEAPQLRHRLKRRHKQVLLALGAWLVVLKSSETAANGAGSRRQTSTSKHPFAYSSGSPCQFAAVTRGRHRGALME